jgi:hypothetical protein
VRIERTNAILRLTQDFLNSSILVPLFELYLWLRKKIKRNKNRRSRLDSRAASKIKTLRLPDWVLGTVRAGKNQARAISCNGPFTSRTVEVSLKSEKYVTELIDREDCWLEFFSV